MFKNTSSQKIAVFAFDTTSGAAKTGDSANISAYVSKDWGSVTQLGDTSATEMDSTNAKGWYLFDLTQGETNADALLFTGKSSTSNISIVGQLIFTRPANFTTMSIDGNGRVDVIKIAGTTQTARDIGTSVLISSGSGTGQLDVTSGVVKANATQWLGGTIPAVNVTGVPLVDLKYTLGTISPATAGSVRADSVTGNVGGSVASLTTNNDKTGYTLTSGYDPAKTAAQAGDAMALTSGERNSTADAFLNRDMSTGTDSGSPSVRTVRQALRFLRNKWSISTGTLTVTKEDDSTASWTATVTTDPAAEPIVSNDPA
jgi:hypothetical protein